MQPELQATHSTGKAAGLIVKGYVTDANIMAASVAWVTMTLTLYADSSLMPVCQLPPAPPSAQEHSVPVVNTNMQTSPPTNTQLQAYLPVCLLQFISSCCQLLPHTCQLSLPTSCLPAATPFSKQCQQQVAPPCQCACLSLSAAAVSPSITRCTVVLGSEQKQAHSHAHRTPHNETPSLPACVPAAVRQQLLSAPPSQPPAQPDRSTAETQQHPAGQPAQHSAPRVQLNAVQVLHIPADTPVRTKHLLHPESVHPHLQLRPFVKTHTTCHITTATPRP